MTTDPPKLAQLRTLPRNFCPLQDPRLDKPIAISRLTMEAEEAAPIAPVTAMAAMEAVLQMLQPFKGKCLKRFQRRRRCSTKVTTKRRMVAS